MAYQEFSINSLNDIPALVSSFAAGVGWIVSGTAEQPILQNPNYQGTGLPGGLSFRLRAAISGLNHDLIWECTTAVARGLAIVRSPILATEAAPTVGVAQTPTKVFLISMLAPEPYLVIVIEYGYNSYRHLYLGNMEKIGAYSGGEVISGGGGPIATVDGGIFFYHRARVPHLFGGNQSVWAIANSGGVYVDHPDNAQPWRVFRGVGEVPIGNSLGSSVFNGGEVIGGFGDSYNDAYVQKGKNPIAGAAVLVPINLFATLPVTDDTRFIPIGRPAGVRMINIQEIEAQASVTVSGETWHTFAALRKSNANSMNRPGNTGNRWRLSETSFYLGYAYRGS